MTYCVLGFVMNGSQALFFFYARDRYGTARTWVLFAVAVIAALNVFYTAFALKIVRRIGERTVVVWACLIGSVSMVFMAFAPSFEVLMVAVVLCPTLPACLPSLATLVSKNAPRAVCAEVLSGAYGFMLLAAVGGAASFPFLFIAVKGLPGLPFVISAALLFLIAAYLRLYLFRKRPQDEFTVPQNAPIDETPNETTPLRKGDETPTSHQMIRSADDLSGAVVVSSSR